jgi:hypothetical protein
MKKISPKAYTFQYAPGAGVVVSFGKDGSEAIDGVVFSEMGGEAKVSGGDYIKRGTADDRLLQMHKIATESPNKWALISTKASFIGGWGFRLFDRIIHERKEVHVPYYSDVFDEWHEKLDLDLYHQAACYQVAFGSELNVKISFDVSKKVAGLEVIDNNEIRPVKLKKGETKISRFLLSSKFGYSKSVKTEDCLTLPAFDLADPYKYPVAIIHSIKQIPMQKFHGLAEWWGTAQWAETTNEVPKYYKAAFRNGFFVTHHISFPDDYFDEEGLDDEAIEAAKKKTLNDIADTLSGIEEANKILVTFSKYTTDGKNGLKEVKVTPIANPIKDEAFIKMFNAGNEVQAQGHQIPGNLAGIHFGSGGSSGLEISAEADYLQDYLTYFDRSIVCKAVKIAKRLDGIEPKQVIGIKRMETYTPDSTPKASPANPNK